MVCPSRAHIANKNQWDIRKKTINIKTESKEISEEEHEKRVKSLKEQGILK